MRQSFDPGPGVSISSLAWEYPPGWTVPEHAHVSDQLIYGTHGVMEVAAAGSLWLIPPQFAVWIPAHVPHAIRMPRAVSMRTLYLRPGLARGKTCAVLHVSALGAVAVRIAGVTVSVTIEVASLTAATVN